MLLNETVTLITSPVSTIALWKVHKYVTRPRIYSSLCLKAQIKLTEKYLIISILIFTLCYCDWCLFIMDFYRFVWTIADSIIVFVCLGVILVCSRIFPRLIISSRLTTCSSVFLYLYSLLPLIFILVHLQHKESFWQFFAKLRTVNLLLISGWAGQPFLDVLPPFKTNTDKTVTE